MDGGVVETKEVEKELQLEVEAKGPIEIPKETLDFFGNDEIRSRVFYEKYALRDKTGKHVERTPKEMWDRVSSEIANAEATDEKRSEWREKFKWLLYDFRFVPGGRIS